MQGDGIGQEVIPAGIEVVKKAAAACGATVSFIEFPWGCDFYRKNGRMMAEDGFDRLQEFDAIYLGAIEPVLVHHPPVLAIEVAAPRELDELDAGAARGRRLLHDGNPGRNHFLADAVTRNHRYSCHITLTFFTTPTSPEA